MHKLKFDDLQFTFKQPCFKNRLGSNKSEKWEHIVWGSSDLRITDTVFELSFLSPHLKLNFLGVQLLVDIESYSILASVEKEKKKKKTTEPL